MEKADYISREAAIERFCNVYCGCSPEECGFKIPQDGAEECAAVRALKEVPAADVVKVCRCAECAKAIRKEIGDGELVYWCTANFIYRCRDDYCSRGERRLY